MKKICILMIIFIVNLIICLGQNGEPLTYETTRCLVKISDKNIINKDVNINAFTNDMGLNSIFNQCGVLSVKQIFDYSKNESLLKIYEIDDEDGFKHDAAKPERRVAESMTSNINLYPNPAKDYIVVEYNAEGLSDKLTMTISDMEGKMVYSKKLSYSKDSVKVDVKGLTNGNYILNICSEGNVVYSKKFVVNNK